MPTLWVVSSTDDGEVVASVDDGLVASLHTPPAITRQIPVHISYEIIRLFSEGLYQSPHKAVEELVSNSYDAGAKRVEVLLPETADGGSGQLPPLWVIDDGSGMDTHGFEQLWRIADSEKAAIDPKSTSRPPIGQFGIGKLAAYVLAWRLTHISKSEACIHCTDMNFRKLAGVHQYEETEAFGIDLYELTEEQAKEALADVESRSPSAWARLFGPKASKTWTAAGLSDFKELYDRLGAGRLRWVLSTGLPLHSDFSISVNGNKLQSSKESGKVITTYTVGGSTDDVATGLGLTATSTGIAIPGIAGEICGSAVIYQKRLTEGKSDQYSRSHGFFVKVRGRVVNLEDELFGLDALNHAAWSRFSMEITADGLRDHLLSSREGVRESNPTIALQKYMHGVFNVCRRAFDDWTDKDQAGIDIESLLRDAPSLFITEPLVDRVRDTLEQGHESFYVTRPEVPEDADPQEWLRDWTAAVAESPFKQVRFEATGGNDRALRYIPETRTLILNTDHPYVDKISTGAKNRGPVTLFGTSEVLLDALMHDQGLSRTVVADVLQSRDRTLRLIAGDHPATAAEVLRLLDIANSNDRVLERATGAAFLVLGFEYEKRGGPVGGTDGVLYARLGRGEERLEDYRLVYDAKQTSEPSVPADKIDISSLEDFRNTEDAHFGFFLAHAYAAQSDLTGKLNRKIKQASAADPPARVTLLRIADLRRLVELHYRYGVTLTKLRGLFETANTVPDVDAWIDALEIELRDQAPQVPLQRLLLGLETAKIDALAAPNIRAVRATDPELSIFEPDRLIAALQAVEVIVGKRWIEVEKSSGDVRLHHHADQIVTEVERLLGSMFGPPDNGAGT